jgi:hypothetical protein
MSLEDVRDFEKRMQEETNEKVRGILLEDA